MHKPLPEFSPACPIPYVLQPEDRVKQLQAILETEFGQIQRVNIEALIHLYENGVLGPRQRTDPPVFLVDGVRVEKDPWKDKSVPAHALTIMARGTLSNIYIVLAYTNDIFRRRSTTRFHHIPGKYHITLLGPPLDAFEYMIL
jgi:hypothetical protein